MGLRQTFVMFAQVTQLLFGQIIPLGLGSGQALMSLAPPSVTPPHLTAQAPGLQGRRAGCAPEQRPRCRAAA